MSSDNSESPPTVKKIKIEEDDDTFGSSQTPAIPFVELKSEPIKEELNEEEIVIKDEVVEEEMPLASPLTGTKRGPKTKKDPKTGASTPNKTDEVQNQILQFEIHLIRGPGAPRIWRRFQVPANYTFHQFHIAIQKTMGWKSVEFDYHLHAFSVVNPTTGIEESIVTREDVDIVEDSKDENGTKIIEYFTKPGQKCKYEYDFGISWMHEVAFEKTFKPVEGETYPRCVEGEKACPPEDGVVHSDEEYDSDVFDSSACF